MTVVSTMTVPGTRASARLGEAAYAALRVVLDPELDEPITDLGFVRSVATRHTDAGLTLEVHLRLPTSFCSPNFAYLMASDSKDALRHLVARGEVDQVVVELDDHHDSDLINVGLATDAGYVGTFRHEADHDLEDLRRTFQRKAHTAAMERCLTALLRADASLTEAQLPEVAVGDLPRDRHTDALLRRRAALDLGVGDEGKVFVDHTGRSYRPEEVSMQLRRARSTRVSIDGNAHFCRGLLRTRYPDSGADQSERVDGAEPAATLTSPQTTFIPPHQLKERHP